MTKQLIKEKAALEEYAAAVVAIRALKDEYKTAFEMLAELERRESKALEKFKELARTHTKPGETITLFDDDVATVKVIAKQAGVTYDPVVARRRWSSTILDKVLVVDKKKVSALVETGDLNPKEAAEAEVPGEQLTSDVRIEVHAFKGSSARERIEQGTSSSSKPKAKARR